MAVKKALRVVSKIYLILACIQSAYLIHCVVTKDTITKYALSLAKLGHTSAETIYHWALILTTVSILIYLFLGIQGLKQTNNQAKTKTHYFLSLLALILTILFMGHNIYAIIRHTFDTEILICTIINLILLLMYTYSSKSLKNDL